jgi:hypothetical protein
MHISRLRFPLAAGMFAVAALMSSCKDDHEHDDENELITTVRLTLTPLAPATGQPVVVQWRDVDGSGGAAPTIDNLSLAPNTTYTGRLMLADESKNPSVDITAEIEGEKNDHIFFYEPNPAGLMTITRTDRDSRNLEVGLDTRVQTSAATTTPGSLKITLRHQPNGTKNGTFAPGDTDAEVTFPVTIR